MIFSSKNDFISELEKLIQAFEGETLSLHTAGTSDHLVF